MDSAEPNFDVAIATDRTAPRLDPDNALLLSELERRGVRAQPVVWDDPSFDPTQFRSCVIRSTWDYLDHPAAFLDWAERTAKATRLLNPPSALRWNSHKRYLVELASAGVPTVDTEWVEVGDDRTLADVLSARGWDRAVVKPAVSASGRGTFRVDRRDAAASEEAFAEARRHGDVLVQTYLSTVEAIGEISLVFVGGRFAHAVRQKPAVGDFRVQAEFGGERQLESPGTAALLLADRVLGAAPTRDLLYARVDLLTDVDGDYLLNELELIEPCLHLAAAASTVSRLADAIERMALERAPWLA